MVVGTTQRVAGNSGATGILISYGNSISSPNASYKMRFECTSENIKHNITEIDPPVIAAHHIKRKRRFKGSSWVEGSFTFPVNNMNLPWILPNALGQGTVTTAVFTSTGWNTHTFYPGSWDSNRVGSAAYGVTGTVMTINVIRNDDNFVYWGCRVKGLTLKQEMNQPLMATVEIIGSDMSIGSAVTTGVLDFPDDDYANSTGWNVQYGSSSGSLATEYLESFEIVVSNGFATGSENHGYGYSAGSQKAALNALPFKRREIMINTTQRWDTSTSYNRMLQNTVGAFKFSNQINGTSTSEIQFNFERVYLNDGQPEFSSRDASVILSQSYVAVADSVGTDDCTFYFTNTQSSYAL